MNRSSISIVLAYLIFAGCAGKRQQPGAEDSLRPVRTTQNLTTQIMPPEVTNKGADTLDVLQASDEVVYYIYFDVPPVGAKHDTVWISYQGQNHAYYNQNVSGPPANFSSLAVSYAGPVFVNASIGGVAPDTVNSMPTSVHQYQGYGWDITDYFDHQGNHAIIAVMDAGTASPSQAADSARHPY